MFVKDYMTRHPIMIGPEAPVAEAEQIMTENKIRHLPVVGDGKRLVGLITRERLSLKPDALSSLDVWEITRYVSNLTVKQLMLKADKIHTGKPDHAIERAARMMAEHKISCMPVLEDGVVVGILTDSDLLRSVQDMLGLQKEGVRVTMRMPNQRGEFAKLTTTIAQQGWGIMGIGGVPTARRDGYYDIVLKIPHVTPDQVEAVLCNVPEQELIDIRESV